MLGLDSGSRLATGIPPDRSPLTYKGTGKQASATRALRGIREGGTEERSRYPQIEEKRLPLSRPLRSLRTSSNCHALPTNFEYLWNGEWLNLVLLFSTDQVGL